MTSLVSAMTSTYRVKGPARTPHLPRSFEARFPQGTGPLFFRGPAAPSAGAAPAPLRSRSARSFTNCSECSAGLWPAPHSEEAAGAGARSRLPCPISGVPTHKHRPARCACALGRPPVACSDASPACAGRPRRVWTQPRWSFIASLAQRPPHGVPNPLAIGAIGSAAVSKSEGCGFKSCMASQSTKPLGELTLRGAQTGRNDWAASEPVTDNPFNTTSP